MSQLKLEFPLIKTIVKAKKLTRRQEDSIMNYTTTRLLGKQYKRK